jgi:hypothetical protein
MNLGWAKNREDCADLIVNQSAHEPPGDSIYHPTLVGPDWRYIWHWVPRVPTVPPGVIRCDDAPSISNAHARQAVLFLTAPAEGYFMVQTGHVWQRLTIKDPLRDRVREAEHFRTSHLSGFWMHARCSIGA